MDLLVCDIGTSSIRAAIVRDDATVAHEQHRTFLPDSPAPGMVEFDAAALAAVVLDAARAALDAHGAAVAAVGITNQRGSAVVWDRATGVPIGPAQGWQDLRTIVSCLTHRAEGFRFAPNTAATKFENILDTFDPERSRDLCVGTVDSWIAWTLTEGAHHVMDATNGAITSMLRGDGSGWHAPALDALRVPERMLPALVDTSGVVGPATALPGAPPDRGAGRRPAGFARRTGLRGTGSGEDHVRYRRHARPRGRPRASALRDTRRGRHVPDHHHARRRARHVGPRGDHALGRHQRGVAARRPRHHSVVRGEPRRGPAVRTTPGVSPTFLRCSASARPAGTTAPAARCSASRVGAVGPRSCGRCSRASPSGAPTSSRRPSRIPGRRSRCCASTAACRATPTFVQALADAAQKPVEISPVCEATTLGAGFMAGLAVGAWAGLDDLAATWAPIARSEPGAPADRDRWRDAVDRAVEVAPRPLGGRLLSRRAPARRAGRAGRAESTRRIGTRARRLRADSNGGVRSVRVNAPVASTGIVARASSSSPCTRSGVSHSRS